MNRAIYRGFAPLGSFAFRRRWPSSSQTTELRRMILEVLQYAWNSTLCLRAPYHGAYEYTMMLAHSSLLHCLSLSPIITAEVTYK